MTAEPETIPDVEPARPRAPCEVTMRRVRYAVAASLDGYIAGPHGEFDWIPMDPDIDFKAMYAGYGAIVMGRASYDVARGMGEPLDYGMPTYVYSRSLPEGTANGVTVVNDAAAHVEELRRGEGKDIWLWGGGELYRSFAELGLVDAISIAVIPIVLGGGIPFAPAPGPRRTLRLLSHRVYPATGTVILDYEVL